MQVPAVFVEESQADHGRAPLVDQVGEPPSVGESPLIEEETLIEEVSIDGMCGVY